MQVPKSAVMVRSERRSWDPSLWRDLTSCRWPLIDTSIKNFYISPFALSPPGLEGLVPLIPGDQTLFPPAFNEEILVLARKHRHTKCHRPGGSNNRHFLPMSGGQKSKVKVSTGLVSSDGFSPWLLDDHHLHVTSHGLLLCVFLYGHQSHWMRAYPRDPI